jgi:hypothetical protein
VAKAAVLRTRNHPVTLAMGAQPPFEVRVTLHIPSGMGAFIGLLILMEERTSESFHNYK